MDQLTPAFITGTRPRRSAGRRILKWVVALPLALSALIGALRLGLWAGEERWPLPDVLPAPLAAVLQGASSTPPTDAPILYYRDPDGKLAYSSEPRKTADERDYVPVRVGGDVSFDAPAEGPGKPETGERTVLYYRNPMGLPDTSPVPKKDSMGMDYLPVYAGEEDDGSTVKVSPGKLQRTGVRSEIVERRVVTRSVRAPGTVKLDERRVAVISLRSESFIDGVENVTTGDQVRKGQPLLRLYSPEITSASAQYLSAISEAAGPSGERPLLIDGARRRLENLSVPTEVVADIERTREVPTTITWSAPRDGIVLERSVVEGMRAMPGDVLFRLADISTVWVLADVPEHDLAWVRPDQPVSIWVRSLPGWTFNGRVSVIYPQVNPETRTTRVRIELPNKEGLLLANMYADVEFAAGADKAVIAVPENALIDTGTRQVVLLDRGEGRFEPREVTPGLRGNGYVEIRKGVEAGEKVVVAANFLIDAESNLKAALQGMSAPIEETPQ